MLKYKLAGMFLYYLEIKYRIGLFDDFDLGTYQMITDELVEWPRHDLLLGNTNDNTIPGLVTFSIMVIGLGALGLGIAVIVGIIRSS